uniref:Acetyl-CoA carboxylase n=1 Tax=Globodera rostochiensis TaxID=31243 RepID=A0A914I9B7_GLORO
MSSHFPNPLSTQQKMFPLLRKFFGPAEADSRQDMPGPSNTPTMQTFRVSKFDGPSTQLSSNQVDQKNRIFPDIESFVNDFCEDSTKPRYIKRILVATNGIAAVKCILSMRKLLMQLFRDDRIIKFICLTTEQEIQSKAEYLKMADYLVFSPAGANSNNYANVDEIVEHATRNNVDAVWAGWGHASENPRLPDELSKRNIGFIGPPSHAMYSLGDKIASTIVAQTVQIPTIEWSGSGLVAPEPSDDPTTELEIPKDLYHKACVTTTKEGLQSMKEKNITYPVMIKASEGGGGKGIRKCLNDEEFRLNFRRVQAEVPGSPIFIMKCMINARHIEVQLIADQYGQVIPIFTRDCSIQRRCQKIIEEAPAGIVPQEIQRQMQMDAVNLAKKVGYVSAGTVEYMYLPSEQKYYFLELNPRLQVEHPCTEMVANINIPAVQLQIAMGIPLHRITEIRLFFGMDRYGTSPLPEEQCRTDTNISVIAARITSEDPAEGFRPASGSVEVLNFQSNQNVWGYFSVSSTGKVHEFADSQFGHLFAKGMTRYEAISALLCALKELELRATFTSQGNNFHTGWLDARIASRVQESVEYPTHISVAIGATLIGHARITEVFSKFQAALEKGQILPKSVMVNRFGPINFLVCLNESIAFTVVRELGNGTLLVTHEDQAYTCHLEEESERFKVIIGKTLTIFDKENDPSMLRSKNAGRFLQYLKKDGLYVTVGEVFAEMESMKMVINLEIRKAGGRLVQVAQPGQVLFPGTLIARLEDQDDIAVAKPVNFTDKMKEWDITREKELQSRDKTRLNTRFDDLIQSCNNILSGYAMPEPYFRNQTSRLIDDLFVIMRNPRLPYILFQVMLHAVENRISRNNTYNRIKELIADEARPFPAIQLTEEMEGYLSGLDPSELGIERQYFEALLKICDRFEDGLEGHVRIVVDEFLEMFLGTEHYFQDVSYDKGVSSIRANVSDTSSIVRMIFSHTKVSAKNAFLKELLSRLDAQLISKLQLVFKRIANMFNPEIDSLAIFVRQMLNKVHQCSYGEVAKQKLELQRIPLGAEDVTTSSDSPYLIFRANDGGVSRIFIRCLFSNISSVLSTPDKFHGNNKFEALKVKITDLLDGACGEIRVRTAADKTNTYDCNHIFLRLDYDPKLSINGYIHGWATNIADAVKDFEKYLVKHRVAEVEICHAMGSTEGNAHCQQHSQTETVRVIYANETGAIPEICIYKTTDDKLRPFAECGHARLTGRNAQMPHHNIHQVNIQKKRFLANKIGTTYVYDFPLLFGKAALDEWMDFMKSDPESYNRLFSQLTHEKQQAILKEDVASFAKAFEMVLPEENDELKVLRDEEQIVQRRAHGSNNRGMVAWEMDLWTPDAPLGRKIVLIANDITFQMGSFSMREHELYQKASEYSRKHRMPRVYVAANSGARIGFASDVKNRLNIVWNDKDRPEDGFKYLSLDCKEDEGDILSQVESTITEEGHHRIDAVIGKENDIGVENLVGSGLIAGETSAAYREVPTYCLVSGRAVGIGAYVARLSHRICQVESSHIILTGAGALNSVLGREVYTSNNQLGGPQIMFYNGVSHSVAKSDLEGVKRILHWITYLPPPAMDGQNLAQPLAMFKDDHARLVNTHPTKSAYDPRTILDSPDGDGLFDRGTFDEIMCGWAKTIITGRARLRGLPVGVVAVETRTVECELPADPATQDSQSRLVQQAGQVWYPDSAFKTAEAISDFNREGIPLIILANIRGFSGGQKDMFEMVLKFGANIVDALQTYTQPIVVYLPPFGELRGGAWAVLDTKINPTCITMLADPDCRGGVLEASGIVEIKFREKDLLVLLKKCDPKISKLERMIATASEPTAKEQLKDEYQRRVEKLLPICRAAAVKFADLHDTTARMLQKGAIHDEVQWQDARNYMYELISVHAIKLQMARRYLEAIGHSSANTSVDELATGIRWVDEHLQRVNVQIRRALKTDPQNSSKRTRFVYFGDQISKYADGDEFRTVLAAKLNVINF